MGSPCLSPRIFLNRVQKDSASIHFSALLYKITFILIKLKGILQFQLALATTVTMQSWQSSRLDIFYTVGSLQPLASDNGNLAMNKATQITTQQRHDSLYKIINKSMHNTTNIYLTFVYILYLRMEFTDHFIQKQLTKDYLSN